MAALPLRSTAGKSLVCIVCTHLHLHLLDVNLGQSTYPSFLPRATATIPAKPPRMPGMPCRLWTPQVSCMPRLEARMGCRKGSGIGHVSHLDQSLHTYDCSWLTKNRFTLTFNSHWGTWIPGWIWHQPTIQSPWPHRARCSCQRTFPLRLLQPR